MSIISTTPGFGYAKVWREGQLPLVNYLIKQANSRPKYTLPETGRISLGTGALAELVNMYHGQQATKCHDRVLPCSA
jgi:hypothetical protein